MEQVSAILLFDDGRGDLGPLSDLRASFEQRTGGRTLLEAAVALREHPVRVATAPRYTALVTERLGAECTAPVAAAICVNGRMHARMDAALRERFDALHVGSAMVSPDGSVIAARLAGAALQAFIASVVAGAPSLTPDVTVVPTDIPLWSRPWHLLEASRFGAIIAADIEAVAAAWEAHERGVVPAHATQVGTEQCHIHATARLGVGVVLDTSNGAILVDRDAEVRHGSIVTGPAFIGAKTIVSDRSVLKARTALGPQCRAAGEIGSVIFQGCTNKAHDGHLGDALLGEWVNLGAGTLNSNLLNTYADVAMRLRASGPLERTGRQFMGCVIGDHVKLAIGTRIMTGACIGTGVMWAAGAAVIGAVEPFAWVTDDGERRFRLDKFMEIATTVMARRGRSPLAAESATLAAVHAASPG